MSLNWIDVSNIKNMSELFNYRKVYYGDMSLWDVSNVMDMEYMFDRSDYYGDISDWQINKHCRISHMFKDAILPEERRPRCLKDMEGYSIINEGFDIDDMENEVGNDPRKERVRKVSKQYSLLEQTIRELSTANGLPVYTGTDGTNTYEMMCENGLIDLLDEFLANPDSIDEDTYFLAQANHVKEFYTSVLESMMRMYCHFAVGYIAGDDSYDGVPLEVIETFEERYIQTIHSRDHMFYAWKTIAGPDDVIDIVHNMSNRKKFLNFNWINTGIVKSLDHVFSSYRWDFDVSLWDVSNVQSMNFLFYNTVFKGDLSQWDTHNVRDMEGIFAESKFNGDVSMWDVSNVRYLRYAFYMSNIHYPWTAEQTPNLIDCFYVEEFDRGCAYAHNRDELVEILCSRINKRTQGDFDPDDFNGIDISRVRNLSHLVMRNDENIDYGASIRDTDEYGKVLMISVNLARHLIDFSPIHVSKDADSKAIIYPAKIIPKERRFTIEK